MMSITSVVMFISLIVFVLNRKREVEGLVHLGDYPYMAIIGESCGGDDIPEDWHLDEVICQGTLVSPIWVLTASHCDTRQQLWETTYYALTGFLRTTNITKAQRRAIIEWIPFGEENPISVFTIDDILLCKLIAPIDGVQVAMLPAITWQLGGFPEPAEESLTNCLYVGWENYTDTAIIKSKVKPLSIIELYKRAQIIGISANLYVHQSPNINGIPGGALICNGTQVGIFLTSIIEVIGIYTKIAKYMPWVDNILKLETVNLELKISEEITNRRSNQENSGDVLHYEELGNNPSIDESMLSLDSAANRVSTLTLAVIIIIFVDVLFTISAISVHLKNKKHIS